MHITIYTFLSFKNLPNTVIAVSWNGYGDVGKNWNENEVLDWECMRMVMGMISWEWDWMGTVKVIPMHVYM